MHACVYSEVIAPINDFGGKPPIDFTLAGYTDMRPEDFVYFKTPGEAVLFDCIMWSPCLCLCRIHLALARDGKLLSYAMSPM